MTHVLVLAAVDVEARGLARHLGLEPVGGAGWPHYRGGALEIAGIGVRGSCLEERVAGGSPPSLVVSAGACGALAPDLAAGDLVVPETVIAPTGARHATDPRPGLVRAGALLTVAELVETPAAKARLWVATGALAVDMESATVADTAQQTVPADLAALVEPGGGVRAGRALRVALGRPRAVADAVILGRGTAAALKTVAAALGKIVRA
ncbi:MAG: hypothetical protein AUG00_08020 [Candidatus Rokubacteria bacterium 13_1_20CM_2_70_7]|nr:MAG: hypothetical protein AUG00_08020 [Candidatus Rokubacteria bacterium 13_1_20CM_2_70_7]